MDRKVDLGHRNVGVALGLALVAAVPSFLHTPATAALPEPGRAERQAVQAGHAQWPLYFERNAGQTDPAVRFLSRGEGYTVQLTPDSVVVSLARTLSETLPSGGRGPDYVQSSVVRMQFVGAAAQAEVRGVAPLSGNTHYYVGSNRTGWHQDVATFAKVRYESLYPGIDLVLYGKRRQLEYDLVVAPGADPSRVTLAFDDLSRDQPNRPLRIDEAGDLVIETDAGELRMTRPFVYQEIDGARKQISANYVSRGSRSVGVEVAAYDRTRPLVIDPVLLPAVVYSTLVGGTAEDGLNVNVEVDEQGFVYLAGDTSSLDFPVTSDAYQSTYPGQPGAHDLFLAKLDQRGHSLVWATYFGGGLLTDQGLGDEAINGMAIDAEGSVYVTGPTLSTNFPTTPGVWAPTFGAFGEGFLSKFDTDGELVYSTYVTGSLADYPGTVALGNDGTVFVAGQTTSPDFHITPGAAEPDFTGGPDGFVQHFNADGTDVLYSTYVGGMPQTYVHDIETGPDNSVYITGITRSASFPVTLGAFQMTFGGAQDAFVMKLNPTGTARVYSTYLGNAADDSGTAIAVDTAGNAYVGGRTDDFPTTPGSYQPVFAGGPSIMNDGFVAKLNPTGTGLVYATYLGGSEFDGVEEVAIDDAGAVYATGFTASVDFPTTAGAIQTTHGGGFSDLDNGATDAFVTKLDPTGATAVYSTFLGGGGNDHGWSITTASNEIAYVAGNTFQNHPPTPTLRFPTTPGAFQNDLPGSFHPFVTKIATHTCGDGELETGEECDDGNELDDDGCSAICALELDDFLCYRATNTSQTPDFTTVPGIDFEDLFGAVTRDLYDVGMLCNPASVFHGEPAVLAHPDHLEAYKVTSASGTPGFVTVPGQVVVTRFGSLTVDVKEPLRVMTPTAKSLVSPPPPLVPSIDSFVCHKISRSPGTPAFTKIFGIDVEDQFGDLVVNLKKPKTLCSPASVDGNPVNADAHIAHFLCYQAKVSPDGPSYSRVNSIFVDNEFATEQIDAIKTRDLCIPAVVNP